MPPSKNGDYAFLLHIINSLKSTGSGAVILPHGVLFRGNVEASIRKEIIKRGYIKGIIGLPANLFYGTGIPACIIVLDKKDCSSRESILMIDAGNSFIKDGNKNRSVSRYSQNSQCVYYANRDKRILCLVPVSEIIDPKNDYNLNIPRYIDSGYEDDIHDLKSSH